MAENEANSRASISFNRPAIPGNLKSMGFPSLVFILAFILNSLVVMSLEMRVVITVAKWGSFKKRWSSKARGHTIIREGTAAQIVTWKVDSVEEESAHLAPLDSNSGESRNSPGWMEWRNVRSVRTLIRPVMHKAKRSVRVISWMA